MNTPLAIEVEMRSERASALKRVTHKLEALIGQIAMADAELAKLQGADFERRKREREALRTEAEQQRWYLIVQREAMGLTHHGDIDLLYPLPSRLPA